MVTEHERRVTLYNELVYLGEELTEFDFQTFGLAVCEALRKTFPEFSFDNKSAFLLLAEFVKESGAEDNA